MFSNTISEISNFLDNLNYELGYYSPITDKFLPPNSEITINDFLFQFLSQDINKLLSNKYLTCLDIVEIEKYLFDKKRIQAYSVLFSKKCLKNNQNKKIKHFYSLHWCIIYYLNNKYYYFEHIAKKMKTYNEGFDNIKDLLIYIKTFYKINYNISFKYVYVYNKVPLGLTGYDILHKWIPNNSDIYNL